MTIHEPHRLSELEEILGELHHVEETDGDCLALIGKIHVLLPQELAEKLQSLVGKGISILKLEGYHVRSLDGEKHA